jgi:hypothetical protein
MTQRYLVTTWVAAARGAPGPEETDSIGIIRG